MKIRTSQTPRTRNKRC